VNNPASLQVIYTETSSVNLVTFSEQ